MNMHFNNLMKMVNKSNQLKNENVKEEYINELIAYALFVYYSGYITEEEFNYSISKIQTNPCVASYLRERNNSINNFITNNSLLNNFYYRALSIYQNYDLRPLSVLNIDKNIKDYFISFLKYMNCYDLYEELENKKRISYESPVLGHSICVGNKSKSYIIINENDNFYRYLTLSHEIAHALENRVLKKRKQYFDSPYINEIMSITFNRIFIEYLKENNVLSGNEINTLKNNIEINCHRYIEWSFIITEAVKHGNFFIDDYDIVLYIDKLRSKRSLTDHNYGLGSVFSLSLLNMWRKGDRAFINDIPNMLFFLSKMNLKELIELFDKYDNVEKELDKILSKKRDINSK